MKRFFRLMPALTLIIMLFAGMFMGILQKDHTYSSAENRMLQKLPKPSAKKILRGKFQKKYETYLSDQFPKRDSWIKLQTTAERAFGKKESNGVYFGKDGYLLEKYTKEDFDEKLVKRNITALGKFVRQASKTSNVKVMMVPSKTYALDAYLPAFAKTYDENIFYSQLKKELPDDVIVPVCDILQKNKNDYIYYRTDHHWTTLGAWYGYCSYLDAFGKNLKNADLKKEQKKVCDNFLGTTHSKVNMYSQKDEISIYEPKSKMKVIYNLGEKTENSFYQTKFLKKKDKYSVFFGGNQAVLEISGGKKNKKTLLMIKDSFANCFIPFIAEDYEKVIVVDMRHLNLGMSMLLKNYKPKDVLILYNSVQFMQDKEFAIKP